MTDYRVLGPEEIVIESDEVLDNFIPNRWTTHHGYAGKSVKDCKGCVTGKQRQFRRKATTMKYKKGDKVKIVKEGTHRFKIGEEVTITEVFTEKPHYRADSGSDYWFVRDEHIEHIEPTTITRPIDFTGCNPQIADALKQNLSVLCEVWDSDSKSDECKKQYVWGWDAIDKTYRAEDCWYIHAEPVVKKRVLKPITETITLLLQNGWVFSESHYLFNANYSYDIAPSYLQSNAGTELEDDDLPDYLFEEK